MVIIISLVVAATLYILSVRGRTGCTGMSDLRGWKYAHRGLHGDGAPENSLEAFRRAVENGYGAELDVHLLADGELAVIHDSLLRRTTGREGRIEDLTADSLQEYRLEGTNFTIPLFRDVLQIFNGKAPLIVELKSVEHNVDELCRAVCALLESYKGAYCVESFDPRCVRWFRINRPDIIRGQLTEDYFQAPQSKLPTIIKFVMKHQMLNFWTMPDFVAYRYADRYTISNNICRKIWKLQGVTWTLKNRQELDTAVLEGWISIFEGFKP